MGITGVTILLIACVRILHSPPDPPSSVAKSKLIAAFSLRALATLVSGLANCSLLSMACNSMRLSVFASIFTAFKRLYKA